MAAAHQRGRQQEEGRTLTTMHGSITTVQCGLLVLVLLSSPFSPSHGAHAFVSTPSAGVAAVSRQAHPASSLTPSPSAITMVQPRRWTPAAFSRSRFEVGLPCRSKRINPFSSGGFVCDRGDARMCDAAMRMFILFSPLFRSSRLNTTCRVREVDC